MSIYPLPVESNLIPGTVAIKGSIRVENEFSSLFRTHLKNFIKKNLSTSKCSLSPDNWGESSIVLHKNLSEEEYSLKVEQNTFTLEAGGERGAYYGLQSLEQLIKSSLLGELKDRPGFPKRGVMLDISRCKVPKIETLEKIIIFLSRLKINQLQLYVEHTFAFPGHETVWGRASALKPEDIIYLRDFCLNYYIELVPNFNSFGHFERWLRYEKYHHLAESPGGFTYPWGEVTPWGSTLKPNKESLNFLESLYNDYLPLFLSDLFNCGCDETWELGTGWSRSLCEEKGTTLVYRDFLLNIYNLGLKYGKRIMFWGDMILKTPELVKTLPANIIPLLWGYESDHPFERDTALLHSTELEYYVCPGTSSWNSLTGRVSNALENLYSAAYWGRRNKAGGYLITDWGDKGHHQYLPISYPGFVAGAGYAWNPEQKIKEEQIIRAMDWAIFEEPHSGIPSIILDLGRLHDPFPGKIPNQTFFNASLFSTYKLPSAPGPIIKKTLTLLDQLDESLISCGTQSPEGVQSRRELQNSVAMTRFSLQRHLWPDKKNDLRKELLTIISNHKQLWLTRNYTGGLEESSEHLLEILRFFL